MAYYCLTNVKFDNSYKNGCFFSNSQVREEALHPINYDVKKKEVNFNFRYLLQTEITVNDYNMENYCIIEYDNNFYYYFVKNCFFNAVNQWSLQLELDVITQYVTGANMDTFTPCIIERAHINRWFRDGNKVKFNVTRDSQLIIHEREFDKPNVDRKIVNLENCIYSIINNWMRDNIICWQYVYLDVKHKYSVLGYQGSPSQVVPVEYKKNYNNYSYNVEQSTINCDYAILAIPIYKDKTKKIYFVDQNKRSKIYIGEDGLFDFYSTNDQTSYVYNVKFSLVPPITFDHIENISNVTIVNGNLVINENFITDENIFKGIEKIYYNVDCFGNIDIDNVNNYVERNGCFVDCWQTKREIYSELINTNIEYEFNIADVKGNRNKKFEPKIIGDCYSATIRDSSNGEFKYNLLHLNKNDFKVIYTEGLNITNNNYYFRLESSGIVPQAYDSDWHGIVNTVDYSQTVANDNIANFLANNKNFLLTKGATIGVPMVANALTGNIAGVGGGINSIVNTYIEMDNIRNRINSLRNTNDSVILNMLVNEGLKLYVDIEKAFDVDIENFYNYLYMYGYRVNIVDNPFNFINTRKYFNYIKFNCDQININCPQHIDDKIKIIFRNGIRLWNDYSKIYEYQKENYEINLD